MRLVPVPDTHWDREWYEPLAVFQQRLLDLFDGLLSIMAKEPASSASTSTGSRRWSTTT
jgi:alpha-mannosidase